MNCVLNLSIVPSKPLSRTWIAGQQPMPSTWVINIRDAPRFWQESPAHTYIGRNPKCGDTKWGNPFKLANYANDISVVLRLYEAYLFDSGLVHDLPQLANRILVCHCKPCACHGDILRKHFNYLEL